jgi:hypothetical protein
MIYLGLIVGIGFWIFSRSGNSERIKTYIEDRGGEVLFDDWQPFGKGWFGESGESIYKIKYRDVDGDIHECWAKTSLFTGVYLSDDRIIEYSRAEDELIAKLREENSFLKAEIAKLRGADFYEEPLEEITSFEEEEIETTPFKTSTFSTENGNILIKQKNNDIEVGDKVLVDGKPARNGRYKIGTLHYITVKNGRIC